MAGTDSCVGTCMSVHVAELTASSTEASTWSTRAWPTQAARRNSSLLDLKRFLMWLRGSGIPSLTNASNSAVTTQKQTCAGIEHDYKLLNIPGFTNMSMNILSFVLYCSSCIVQRGDMPISLDRAGDYSSVFTVRKVWKRIREKDTGVLSFFSKKDRTDIKYNVHSSLYPLL